MLLGFVSTSEAASKVVTKLCIIGFAAWGFLLVFGGIFAEAVSPEEQFLKDLRSEPRSDEQVLQDIQLNNIKMLTIHEISSLNRLAANGNEFAAGILFRMFKGIFDTHLDSCKIFNKKLLSKNTTFYFLKTKSGVKFVGMGFHEQRGSHSDAVAFYGPKDGYITEPYLYEFRWNYDVAVPVDRDGIVGRHLADDAIGTQERQKCLLKLVSSFFEKK